MKEANENCGIWNAMGGGEGEGERGVTRCKVCECNGEGMGGDGEVGGVREAVKNGVMDSGGMRGEERARERGRQEECRT